MISDNIYSHGGYDNVNTSSIVCWIHFIYFQTNYNDLNPSQLYCK